MKSFQKILEKAVLRVVRARDFLSEHWRRGANQRTIFIVIAGGFVFLYLYTRVVAPPALFPVGELVTVPDGVGLAEVSVLLRRAEVVQNDTALRLVVTLLRRDTRVRAGDYLFKRPLTIFGVARAITTGAFGLEPERIRIHEGATTREMAKIFANRLKRIDEGRFYEKAKPFEGFLFPDTYFFLPNVSEDTIIETMRANFDRRITEVAGEVATFGKPLRDIVIMASLLEREARNTRDRQMIAGVLWNRIEQDMLLQVDAAFLYTLGKGTFQLTLADLASDSPYNTYKYKGLPPTPIGSPSLASIRAAATPIEHSYLYYLADRRGVTYYSKTYDEHLRKKRLYLGS